VTPDSGLECNARALALGTAEGTALVLDEPLSLWGGMDPLTGRVIDGRHPQAGLILSGEILVMPNGRGSSSSSSVLAEAIRLGTAPSGIILTEPDGILMVGSMVARELYDLSCPVVVLDLHCYEFIQPGDQVRIDALTSQARVTIARAGDPAKRGDSPGARSSGT